MFILGVDQPIFIVIGLEIVFASFRACTLGESLFAFSHRD